MNSDPRAKKVSRGLLLAATLDLGQRASRAFMRLMGRPASRDGAAETRARVAVSSPGLPEASKRVADRDLNVERGSEEIAHPNRGTLFVVISFGVAITAGVGFLIVYWTSADTSLLGSMAALFLGGIGVGLVLWSHALMRHKEAIEPRESLVPPPAEVEPFLADFREAEQEVCRRTLLKWLTLTAAGFMTVMGISVMRALGRAPGPALWDTVWKRGQRLVKEDGTAVTVQALRPGDTVIVFPEDSIGDERAQTVLLRVNEQFLNLPREHRDWAPMGYLAYSRVCTHAGCVVGLFQKQTHLLTCPCHQSTFDVLKGAQPTGGPAARPLPQLPLYADSDGYLRAASGFTEPPGPGFWWLTS